MNKVRLEYLFEREHIKNDNLSDVLGQQSQHISELWNEIGQKALKINDLEAKNRRLLDLVNRYRRKLYTEKLDEAKYEKKFKEFIGESVDN
jgi:exonuclease I